MSDSAASHSHYKDDAYLFQDLTLLLLSEEDLRQLITRELPTATDHDDGSFCGAGLQIDHAQDLIEQARDLILDMGGSFDDSEKELLSFLTWPLSEADGARLAAELADKAATEDAERNRRSDKHARLIFKSADAFKSLISGRLDADLLILNCGKLYISRTSFSNPPLPSAPNDIGIVSPQTGEDVLSMVAQLQAAGVPTAKLDWGLPRKYGVPFKQSISPAWSISMDIPLDPDVWSILVRWWHENRIGSAPSADIFWPDEHEPFHRTNITLAHFWPEQGPESGWAVYYHGYDAFPWVRHHRKNGDTWVQRRTFEDDRDKVFEEAEHLLSVGQSLGYDFARQPIPPSSISKAAPAIDVQRPSSAAGSKNWSVRLLRRLFSTRG